MYESPCGKTEKTYCTMYICQMGFRGNEEISYIGQHMSIITNVGGNIMGVASLVLGIIAILIGAFSAGSLGWLGAIVGILGIILGALGRKNTENSGMATGGLVCSIIGTILSLLFYLACVACVGGMASLS